jgi:hypothetical protein
MIAVAVLYCCTRPWTLGSGFRFSHLTCGAGHGQQQRRHHGERRHDKRPEQHTAQGDPKSHLWLSLLRPPRQARHTLVVAATVGTHFWQLVPMRVPGTCLGGCEPKPLCKIWAPRPIRIRPQQGLGGQRAETASGPAAPYASPKAYALCVRKTREDCRSERLLIEEMLALAARNLGEAAAREARS